MNEQMLWTCKLFEQNESPLLFQWCGVLTIGMSLVLLDLLVLVSIGLFAI